jgi:hypothetical protein
MPTYNAGGVALCTTLGDYSPESSLKSGWKRQREIDENKEKP